MVESLSAFDPSLRAYSHELAQNRLNHQQKTYETQLSPEEQDQVKKLQARDAEVRAHETAHLAAAGSLAMGGPNYQYQRGPDGKNYAVGGDVRINTSKGRTPEESLQRAQQIRAAALAPAAPSGQDMQVAAAASRMEMEAQRELQAKDNQDAEETPVGADGANAAGHQTTDSKASQLQNGQTNHNQNPAHMQQCPECMQKFFKSDTRSIPKEFAIA